MTGEEEIGFVSRPRPRGPYLRRHWRGDLPLPRSLWINGVLPGLLGLALLGWVDAWLRLYGSASRAAALLLLLGWPLLLAQLAWATHGTWRSARREDLQIGTGPLRRLGSPALVGLLLAIGLLQFALNVLPRTLELGALAFWRDPLGTPRVELSADGRRLRIQGPLARGTADQVRTLMAQAPGLRWVLLESADGRLGEALDIAEALRARALPTRATGPCARACAVVFLSGSRRQLLPGARLGFQRVSAGAFNPPHQAWVNASLRRVLADRGLSPHLVTKVLATPPPALWEPDVAELLATGLVTAPERPSDVELPAPQDATVADYSEALSASPLWQAIEQRFPGTLAEAAAAMQAATAAGAEAAQGAGYEVLGRRLPGLLSVASAETRLLYAGVLMAQVDFLRSVDAQLCRSLLIGDAAGHRRLPKALVQREADWLLAALAEPPRSAPPRRPTPVELEVVRHTLGSQAPAQLAGLWRPATEPPPGQPDCDQALALLTRMASLASPERRLAVRLLFERE